MTREARALAATIEELLCSGTYEWARPTLAGMWRTLVRTGRMSEAQAATVTRIRLNRKAGY